MLTIPNNYPEKCTPDEIKTTIRAMQAELAEQNYNINSVLQFSPLINLGQFELGRRQNEAVLRHSNWLGRISIGIAIVALLISAWNTFDGSNWWERQLAVLDTIGKNTAIGPAVARQTAVLQAINGQLGKQITCVLASPSEVRSGTNQSQPRPGGS